MKIVAVSDIHGRTFEDLEREILSVEKPDLIAVLGDYDQVKTIHSLMDLTRRYNVVALPGNHEHAIYNGMFIMSGDLLRQGKDSITLNRELNADPIAKGYIAELLKPENLMKRIYLDEDRFGAKYPTLFVHAGLGGSLHSYPDCPKEIRCLWYRLKTLEMHELNFQEMNKSGIRVMVRGHDKEPSYTYSDSRKGVKAYRGNEADYFRLFDHRLHTITVGDYADGNYAIIDTNFPSEKVPVLMFGRI